jgi:hypothetical protein
MAGKHPPIKGYEHVKHMNRVVRGLAASAGVVALAACAQPAASDITEILVERDCFGCASGSLLVLRRDGTATLSVVGKARHATQDSSASGKLRREDFDALVNLAAGKGFFQMPEAYEAADVQDGAWVITRVRGATRDKLVVHRNGAGPAGLKQFEAAIAAAQARIQFVPDRR